MAADNDTLTAAARWGDAFTAPITPDTVAFQTQDAAYTHHRKACDGSNDVTFHDLGVSEEERPIYGVTAGDGPLHVSCIAGNHADEPVGPETLRYLVDQLLSTTPDTFWRTGIRWTIVPHTNPDGEARNQLWIEEWPSTESYLRHRVRELPGRDMEFGFPDMRQENEIVSDFLRVQGPFDAHLSAHGMGVAAGALLLIHPHWGYRTEALQTRYQTVVAEAGLGMHDHNRQGEKGFFWLGPGFATTPSGSGMRAYFHAQNDDEMASRFLDSSMEFVASLGGTPLSVVTELPLFVLDSAAPVGGPPPRYTDFKEALPRIQQELKKHDTSDTIDTFDLRPLPLHTAMQIQGHVIGGIVATCRAA
ncbi:MAG: M14 family zinc carboxypeptidase [Longimonas sp.]|uniref:M14 family zinc carboxypeptidase n=1 Tax=Longimonas sp. TaxID=2039626 RepID=UPI003363DEE7